jgi:hypothetical protein
MNLLKAANPITVTKGAFGLAGTAVGLAGTVARGAVHAPVDLTRGAIHVASRAGRVARETAHTLGTGQGDEHEAREMVSALRADEGEEQGARPRESGSTGVTEDPNIPGPTVVPAEPHAPAEPPVDVVGAALATEAAAERGEGPDGVGLAHEPHAASRDEEHGDTGLQRATLEEIAEETAAALEGDVEPEEHLTEPLLDSADAKAVAAELATMSKAADTDEG